MVDLPDETRQFVNSGLIERLEDESVTVASPTATTDGGRGATSPPSSNVTVDLLVETEEGLASRISEAVVGVEGVSLASKGAFAGQYVAITAPASAIPRIARIDGVELVHQDQFVGVLSAPDPGLDIPFGTEQQDPIRTALSDAVYDLFGTQDGLLGDVRVSEVEVPGFNFAQVPPGDPFQTAVTAVDRLAGTNITGTKYVPTVTVKEWLLNTGLTGTGEVGETPVSVIDSGHTPTEPTNGLRTPTLRSEVPGEPPLDFMGHGSWCTNMVTGYKAPGVHGTTAGVAPGAPYAHFKALNTFPGAGKTSWILNAMFESLQWGADIISMSLGGTQQGPLDEDPYARFIRKNCKENAGDEFGAIFVVAAGNSGPAQYTIGSPGVSEKALTVGSWSITDQAPANFTSRGPQGGYYSDKPDELAEAKEVYGAEDVVKPDICAPGGGRENAEKAANRSEKLFQVSTGWFDGFNDGLKDNRASMKGTSMATPAVAGFITRLYDAGIIETAAEVKEVTRQQGFQMSYPEASEGANTTENGKNIAIGYGPFRESTFE